MTKRYIKQARAWLLHSPKCRRGNYSRTHMQRQLHLTDRKPGCQMLYHVSPNKMVRTFNFGSLRGTRGERLTIRGPLIKMRWLKKHQIRQLILYQHCFHQFQEKRQLVVRKQVTRLRAKWAITPSRWFCLKLRIRRCRDKVIRLNQRGKQVVRI